MFLIRDFQIYPIGMAIALILKPLNLQQFLFAFRINFLNFIINFIFF